jgi:superfamily II RNA helicase
MKFRGFDLDRFQEEAVRDLEENKSVVVSAATGTGKTLIADYVIDKYLQEGKEIIYTAPIKALSNQKYKDFKALYGEENVGILTGDVAINKDAPLRIMTTEIYRNMLMTHDPGLEDLRYVIFDEVHYLGDEARGKVWEESIIFSDDHVRFLCLSATIPNAQEFADWISAIKRHDVSVVSETERAVPLHHVFYDSMRGFGDLHDLQKWHKQEQVPNYNKSGGNKKQYYKNLKKRQKTVHIDLIRDLEAKDFLPAIYFCFSRKKTVAKAKRLKGKKSLVSHEEAERIQRHVREALEEADEAVRGLSITHTLRQCLSRGIGFHHAGLLPTHKDMVEHLFNQGLIKALFCTETFAVGVNMPARTVCFDSLEKYDGTGFRHLHSKEYFQLAGRAGRRGIDDVGHSVCVVESKFVNVDKIRSLIEGDRKNLKSQFRLTYNTALNLLHRYTDEERETILESSFFAYQEKGQRGASEMKRSYENKRADLFDMGYVVETTAGTELTDKGLFAMNIYHHEILFSELFASDLTNSFNHVEILILVGTILYEERNDRKFKGGSTKVSDSLYPKLRNNEVVYEYFKKNKTHRVEPFLRNWYDGCEFTDLLDKTTMSEGDIFRYFRIILDSLQQIRHASLSDELKDKIRYVEEKIDRDIISVSL